MRESAQVPDRGESRWHVEAPKRSAAMTFGEILLLGLVSAGVVIALGFIARLYWELLLVGWGLI